MTDKIVVQDVFKIFGPRPDEARALLDQGKNKEEIFAATGHTVGVQKASFSIRQGEIFVVMGLSGSGKSTMVRMLNRLIDPTFGEVLIDGQDVTKMSKKALVDLRREDMSMVFQSFALMPHRTVLDNTTFGLEIAGVGRAEREKRALDALEQVGLKPYANSLPDQLSGGMKQRVGLARALATDPTVLLMDEAFSALDPLIRTQMQGELVDLQKQHARTVVFISHDLDEAMRIGDRVAIMEQGQVVQIGTPDDIVRNPANDYVRSFFEGVDVTMVFKGRDLAREDRNSVIDETASPQAALEQLEREQQDTGVVVDGNRGYRGVVTEKTLRGVSDIEGAFVPDVPAVEADTQLDELLKTVANSQVPIPVVEGGKYIGSVSQTTLLQTLDRTG